MESLTPLPDPGDMKLEINHVECHPECLVIMFHAQYNTGCEPDYYILQNEIQRVFKVKEDVCPGGSCLVEDTEGEWHRGRVLGKKGTIYEAFLIDAGYVLAVEETHVAAACDELFELPPKVVLGVFASILPLGDKWSPNAMNYFSSLVGLQITGHVKAVVPHQVFILEVPKIITDVLELKLGKFIDGDSFCLIVETLRVLPQGVLCNRMPELLKQKYPVRELFTLNNSEKPTNFWHVPDELFPCLPVGSKENVKITGAVSPNKFYCQIQKWQKQLEDLTGAMHLYYEALVGENTISCGSLGLLCAAKRQNGQWHRGVIKQVLSDHVEVWFMDFGVTEAVPPSCVQKLRAEFITLPMISFPCALSCFGSQDETVIKFQLKDLMQALIGQTSVCAHVDLYNNTKHLYYITLQKQDLGINAKHPENLNEVAASCVSLLETKLTSIAVNYKPCPERYNSFKNVTGNKDTKTCLPEQDISFSNHCKREEMQLNSFCQAFVVHIINPSDFWIQTCRYRNEFQALMTNIGHTYSQCGADEMVLKKPEPGLLCCAQYSRDGCYYRAVVIKVLHANITVYFLDFGNTDTVPCHHVKILLPQFSDLPALAIGCSLACTFPVDGVWVKKETDFFRSVVLNKLLLLHVIGKQNNKYIVNVHCCIGLQQGSVAACMVQAGYAEYREKPPHSVPRSAQKRHNCKKSKINAESTGNIHKSKISGNGNVLQTEKSLSVSPMPRKSVVPSCFGEGAVSKMHKSVCEEKLFYKEFVFKPGDVFEVVCSCIFSPSDFSCQLQRKLPELSNLMGQIQTYYEDHTSPYKTGQVACVVKCPKDGKWYRATVVQQVSRDEVDVVFVDYGYRERVLLKDLQAVLPDFLTLESQAFRCGLKNVPLQTDSLTWSEEMHRQFEDFVSSRGPLTCVIYALVLVSPNCLCNVVDLQTPLTSAEEFLRERGLIQSEYVGLRNLAPLGSLYSFCYSSFNIKVGSEEEIYITHINNPSKFYCQLNRNTETVEALMKRISDLSKTLNNAKYDTSNTRLCIARYFEDGLFYRALAFPVEATSYVWAHYVDFGNKSVVERDQLMPIPDSATDLIFTPMQAIKCCLSDFRGKKIPASITRWFEERFLGKLLKAVILSRESDGKIVVELYDGQLKVSQKLKEKMSEERAQKSCMGQFRSYGRVRCHIEDGKEINKVSVKNPEILKLETKVNCQVYDDQTDTGENFGDEEQTACSTSKLCSGSLKQQTLQNSEEPGFRNTFSAVPENRKPLTGEPASHSLSYSALTSKEITVNVLSESHNEKLHCTGQQERSNKNTPTLISLPQRDIQMNTEVAVYISHMNSLSSFYVHLAEDENLIIKLANDLNGNLENRSLENCLDELMVGDLIVAEHEADCFYYRAVIKTLKSGNSFEVEFIDYGNAAVVSSSNICRIPEEFLTLPRFSVHCFLSSVKSVPGESWTKESAAYLARKLSNELVTCKFLQQHGGQWEVDVICDGKSVSNDLLQEIDEAGWQNAQICHCDSRPNQNGNPQDKRSGNGLDGQSKTEAVRMKNTSQTPISILHQVINFGQVEAAEVVNMSETGEFYVQLVTNLQILHELNVMLDKEAQRSDLLRMDDIEKGLECMTQSEKNFRWYRSKVIEKFVREKLMLVFFMDYGTCEMVALNNAKVLSDEIKNVPKQAVFCKWIWFKNLKKIQFDHVLNALLDSEIRILFLRFLKSSGIWEVDILIGEVMFQEYLNQFLSHCQTIVGPEKSRSTNCKELGMSFRINSVMWMLLRSGRTYPGFATAVTDPSNFSVQFEVFFDCMRKLSLLLSDVPDNLPALPKEHVAPGASCLIKFGLKAEWYRAEISEVTSQSVVLTFIDYGFLKSIPYSEIHKLKVIPESLFYLPRLAQSCSLHDAVPAKGEHWSDEAILLFQKLLLKPFLIFHFIHYGSEMKLEVDVLYDDSSLADVLIAAGHAVCSQSRCCPIPVGSLKSEETDRQPECPDSSYCASLCEPDYNYDENSDFADRS
ncbi:tudor domain-containing protein 15 [Chiroxiphia lanceolata]|uniref:tudor domain-containing protein 15 n=1 Tax=Chiroxiphia lanceolata TaxID=296741 RepID=UPI0013CF3C9F|nr:tudor domain-containing protein 15 [Chiroxiphia lanceolata]XP_032539247.1 tudor domain-containing protein 15 [Chiroxiphia lanceolata]XP_032539248.1 tudor domain-containing protein 15 [Chiroxiphia lanceolata]XP_032539249.1 tudor domain-containing protein 15 [Chiroxiphia lanceolata]